MVKVFRQKFPSQNITKRFLLHFKLVAGSHFSGLSLTFHFLCTDTNSDNHLDQMELEGLFYGEVGVATWATRFDWSLLYC